MRHFLGSLNLLLCLIFVSAFSVAVSSSRSNALTCEDLFEHDIRYGRLDSQNLPKLQAAVASKDLEALRVALTELLPSGTLGVFVVQKDGARTNGVLDFDYPTDGWLHIRIRDPKEFHGSVIPGFSYYEKSMRFNIQEDRTGIQLSEGEVNLQSDRPLVRLLIQRDDHGKFYDRGTVYQELTLIADHKGRLTTIEIRNGDRRFTRRFWDTQIVEIPPYARSQPRVFFSGEENSGELVP